MATDMNRGQEEEGVVGDRWSSEAASRSSVTVTTGNLHMVVEANRPSNRRWIGITQCCSLARWDDDHSN